MIKRIWVIYERGDMVIKPTNADGTFKRNKWGGGARVERPGYPKEYAREILKQTGNKLIVPKEEKK